METSYKRRAAHRIRDLKNIKDSSDQREPQKQFSDIILYYLNEKKLKPLFDSYIKKHLESRLKSLHVEINKSDYQFINSIWYWQKETISPFNFYYNLKFRRLLDLIGLKLPEEIIFEDEFIELSKSEFKIVLKNLKKKIVSYIEDIIYDDLFLLELLMGNIESYRKNPRLKVGASRSLKAYLEIINLFLSSNISERDAANKIYDTHRDWWSPYPEKNNEYKNAEYKDKDAFKQSFRNWYERPANQKNYPIIIKYLEKMGKKINDKM